MKRKGKEKPEKSQRKDQEKKSAAPPDKALPTILVNQISPGGGGCYREGLDDGGHTS